MTSSDVAGEDTGPTADAEVDDREAGAAAQREHLRGSTLMMAGRFISMALNLVVQVVTVRYLGKTDYGIFAYAIAISSLGASAVILGQDKALGRHLPGYETDGQHGKAQGAMAVAFGTVFVLGASVAAVVIGLDAVGVRLTDDTRAVTVLLILIALTPVLALDSLFVSLLAVVAKPKAIFFRRHVLTPSLRLGSVLFVVLTAGSVRTLAWAYLVSGILGVVVYVVMVAKVLRAHPLGTRSRRSYPYREMWGFGTPMVVNDVVNALRATVVIIMLEAFRSVDEVGAFRAVLPVAQLNLAVMQSFRLLYLPTASRLFARGDREGVAGLYWQSAAWLAVGSFPIFVATFSLAEPLTLVLFGDEFASSATLLAVLAVGYYVNTALGLNSLTLAASGRIRMILLTDGTTAVAALVLNFVLIPQFGALGAALATSSILIIQNVLIHLALRNVLGGLPFPVGHLGAYVSVVSGAGVLLAVQSLLDPPLLGSAVLGLAVTIGLTYRNRHILAVADTLPELRRVPLLGRFVD